MRSCVRVNHTIKEIKDSRRNHQGEKPNCPNNQRHCNHILNLNKRIKSVRSKEIVSHFSPSI